MNSLQAPLYSVDQIRQMEAYAMHTLAIPGAVLMHRAALAAYVAINRHWPDACRWLILAGTGNNAGDGYGLALLALQAGKQVRVMSLGDFNRLAGDAKRCFEAYLAAGGQFEAWHDELPTSDLIVDAVFGIGLNRPLPDLVASVLKRANLTAAKRIAIDVPSGLSADTGALLGPVAFRADLTVSFIASKSGLYTGYAAEYCGIIVLADLDLPSEVFSQVKPTRFQLSKPELPPRPRCAHKGLFGHVLLVGGNHGYSGAIRLAAEACLRSGAGLVSVATREAHAGLINIGRPEIMSHAVEDMADFDSLLVKASVVVVGPGLGRDQWADALLNRLLAFAGPTVWDADALNWLADHPRELTNAILTPHPGEAARLLACTTQAIAADRYQAISVLHARYGGVWVLKGAGSLVSDGDVTWVSGTGNPGMASGGMGDVLAGLCGALLAQGLSTIAVAQLAVYAHGEAADKQAALFGERGMLASDVISSLRSCLNEA